MIRKARAGTDAAMAAMASIANPFEGIDPDAEDEYWRESYPDRPYYSPTHPYAEFSPAYRLGYEGRQRYPCSFESAEPWLRREWERLKGDSSLSWDEARTAARDAWKRIERLSQVSVGLDGL